MHSEYAVCFHWHHWRPDHQCWVQFIVANLVTIRVSHSLERDTLVFILIFGGLHIANVVWKTPEAPKPFGILLYFRHNVLHIRSKC